MDDWEAGCKELNGQIFWHRFDFIVDGLQYLGIEIWFMEYLGL